jgi:hypothetical protein
MAALWSLKSLLARIAWCQIDARTNSQAICSATGTVVGEELPMKGAMCVAGKATLVDLLSTPIGLINVRARAVGQNQAKLSEEARVIEWLEKNQDVEVDQ